MESDVKILTSAVAGGDPNTTSYTMIPTYKFAEKLIGTKNKNGSAWGENIEDLTTKGITIYMKSGDATNGFARAMTAKNDDILLNMGRSPGNSFGDMGSYKMIKDEDKIKVNINYKSFDKIPDLRTGKYKVVYHTHSPSQSYDSKVDTEQIRNNWDQAFTKLGNEYAELKKLREAGMIEEENEQ